MALSRTNRLQQSSSSGHGTGTFTTSSFTPANNSLLLVIAYASGANNDALQGSDITITDSAGLTWTTRETTTTHPNYGYGIRAFTAPVTTGASMTLTLDAGAFDVHMWRVEVYEYTGHNAASPVGATAVGSDADGDDALTITLSASPASSSEVIAAVLVALGGTGVSVTVGTGWTEIFDSAEAGWQNFQSQSRTGSTSTSVTWDDLDTGAPADTLGAAALAVEIKEAVAGPTITDQPDSVTKYAGETATFTVAATGTGTLSYQWKDDGSNVGTNSDTYTTGALTMSDNGAQITCDVTDDNGTTSSNAATLTVLMAARTAWLTA